ncbi:MAG: efflux RND transporter permease subunit [Oscillospiraceae bacterium]|nr:efflux RND transporter permease subunit [Oscillospiraceae bacterium]
MIKYSVKKPFTILVAVVLVLVLGFVSFTRLNTDLLPKMDLPYVIVMTTAPGASPESVETTVTQPLEQALATTNGLENMTSISMENASVIIMEFGQTSNMDSAMIEMSSSIDMVKGYLADTVSAPMLMKLNPDMLPVQVLSVDMDGMDIKELSHYIEEEFSPYLERVDGVATVDVTGLVEDYVSISLNQEKIDKINEAILEKVSETLAKTERELKNAQAQITNGKAELEKQKNDAFNLLADASWQLDQGNAQLQAVLSQKTNLEAQVALLEGAKQAVEGLSQIRMAQAMLQGVKIYGVTADDTLADVINKLENATIEIPSAEGETTTQKDPAAQALAQTVQGLVDSGMFSKKSTVGEIETTLAGQTATIEDTLRSMGINEIIITTGSPQLLDAEISLVKSDLVQAEFMVTQAQAAVDQLKLAYIEAEKGKMAAITAMAVGEVQLQNAQSQLDAGVKEFENARDEALRSANIDSLVTQSMISNILMAQNFSMPAGYIQMGEERITVKVGEKFSDLDQLKNLLLVDLGMDGLEPVHLKDVADVTIRDNAGDSFVRINGNPGIVLSLQKSSVASTSEVSKLVNKAMAELESKTEGLHITTLMDQGDYIGMIVDSVLSNLVYGGIIALLVLVVFLKSFRPTAIIGMSIPLSVLIAIVAMYFSGVTLNIISLSGLALAVGMLVDNSIVVIENIYRLRSLGYSPAQAAVSGTKQVAGAIAASTLTTVCVFVPIVFTQGLTRQLFTDMGLTIAFVLIASLAVAVTFVPCLASNMLGSTIDVSPKFVQKLTAGYKKLLAANLRHKWVVILLSVGLLAFSVYSVFSMPMAFIPAMDGPQMTMTLTVDGTVSDEELYRQGFDIAGRTQQLTDVDTVAVMSEGTSVASLTASAENGKTLSFYVVMDEDRTLSNVQVADLIRTELPEYKDSLSIVTESIDMSALGGSGLSASVKGNDFDTLAKISKDLVEILEDVEGIASADDGSGQRSREMRIEINKAEAMKHGMTTAQVYQLVAAALTEETATTAFTFDGVDIDGVITSDTKYNSESIKDLEIATKINDDGEEEIITLGDVAFITTAESPDSINRDNQSRVYTVSATFEEGVNTTLVSRQAEAALKAYHMPDGYQLDLGGENQMVMEMMGDMLLMILLAVVFIYLIMVAQFQSLLSPFIVLFTIPLAFTGGLLALLITNTVLSIVSMIGFLVLAGVVVNNGIVFVDYINQLRAQGIDRTEAIIQTGADRIRPILMTALTTILAMSTMAFGVGMGAEMSQGMAIVSIGGLAYATLLTLFLVPALYDIMHKKPLKVISVDFEEE